MLLALPWVGCGAGPSAAVAPPDVVVVLAPASLDASAVDAFASGGTRFVQAYAASPSAAGHRAAVRRGLLAGLREAGYEAEAVDAVTAIGRLRGGRGPRPSLELVELADGDAGGAALGQLAVALDASGRGAQTLVLLVGDPPGPDLSEHALRVRFVARWSGHVPAGRVDASSVISVFDALPTLRALAGSPLAHHDRRQGEDVTPALRGEPFEREQPLLWRLPPAGRHGAAPQGASLAVRQRDFKLLLDPVSLSLALYRVSEDAAQQHDLAPELPGVTEYLTTTVLTWDRADRS